jgi:photosystem II stability/assembly factor-like uncharacterized protein
MNKTITLILLLLLSVSVLRAAEWEAVDNGVTANITGISFCSPDTGQMVTHDGQFGYTFDGGRTWQLLPVAANVPLEDVDFVNRDTGIVCGRRGAIYRTTDGGRHWENRSLADTTPWLLSVRMTTGTTAVLLGMTREKETPLRGLSIFTEDAGANWQTQESMGMGYGDLFQRPGGALYFQSWGHLHLSRDGGRTWKSTGTGDGQPGRSTAIVGNTGVLVGNFGMCVVSNDNGKTWAKANVRGDVHFTSVVLLDEMTGYIAGTEGALLKTVDGGKTWSGEALPKVFDIFDLAVSSRYLIAVGTDGLMARKKL